MDELRRREEDQIQMKAFLEARERQEAEEA